MALRNKNKDKATLFYCDSNKFSLSALTKAFLCVETNYI